ncbi:MAG TPA: VWA domain-containing protein [Egibacteraceae bacterium]
MSDAREDAPRGDAGDAGRDVLADAVAFARALRSQGVAATGDRVAAYVAALAALGPRDLDDAYWAGRVALCGRREDIDRYDALFAERLGGGRDAPAPVRRRRGGVDVGVGDALSGEDADRSAVVVTGASRREVLRHRDVAELDPEERAEAARLLAAMQLPGEERRTRRLRPAPHGVVDARRTLRALLARGGEPAELRRRTAQRRPRRVVLLVDVSGSMRRYAAALLRFAHAAAQPGSLRAQVGRGRGPRTEVFTLGTRLTRVTELLALRDPDEALAAVARTVPDWSGGTRLGVLLKQFLDEWGRRGLARGAIVVIMSDGWERDDVRLLAEQMATLQRLAWRVVWANPLKARPGYAPLAAGMAAALPYVDDFVEGHSIAALERLATVVAGRGSRAATRR